MCPRLRSRYADTVSKVTLALGQRLLVRIGGGDDGPSERPVYRPPSRQLPTIAAEASASPRDSSWCESLLRTSAVPVLIVDAANGRIAEGNPAAANLLGTRRDALLGSGFLESFEPACSPSIRRAMIDASETGRAEARGVRTTGGVDIRLKLSLIRSDGAAYLLAHPALRMDVDADVDSAAGSSAVLELLHESPIGFLVTDADFHIEYANRAYLRMIECGTQDAIRGQPLGRWLEFAQAHRARLELALIEARAVEELSMTLRCEQRPARNVSVCAIAVPDGRETRWGFCVSEPARLN